MLPSRADRLQVTRSNDPRGGLGMPGGPKITRFIRDIAIVSVDFDGVLGLNAEAQVGDKDNPPTGNFPGSEDIDVNGDGILQNFDLQNVAGTESVGYGFDERGVIFGGVATQAVLTTCSVDYLTVNINIDDNNFSQVNIFPATIIVNYVFENNTLATVSPQSHTGSRQIDVDGETQGETRLHARLNDPNGMIMASLGVQILNPQPANTDGVVNVAVFLIQSGASFPPPVTESQVSGIIDTVNEIWSQSCVNFEVIHLETLASGGDIDNAPTGNFPGSEDVDLNGNGIFERIETFGSLNVSVFNPTLGHNVLSGEESTLLFVGRNRLTPIGKNPNSVLIFLVNSYSMDTDMDETQQTELLFFQLGLYRLIMLEI